MKNPDLYVTSLDRGSTPRPVTVMVVVEAICILFGNTAHSDADRMPDPKTPDDYGRLVTDWWRLFTNQWGRKKNIEKLRENIVDFDKEACPEALQRMLLNLYESTEELRLGEFAKESKVAASLWAWVRALVEYYRIRRIYHSKFRRDRRHELYHGRFMPPFCRRVC